MLVKIILKKLKIFLRFKIKNLELYFDSPITLAKNLDLRGIQHQFLFNKEGRVCKNYWFY